MKPGAVSSLIKQLAGIHRRFGSEAAAEKMRLLGDLIIAPRPTPRDLHTLHECLCFLQAYPDNLRVLILVLAMIDRMRRWGEVHSANGKLANTGLPGTRNEYSYSYAVLQRMVRLAPGCFDLDWDAVEDEAPLLNALALAVSSGEQQGLEDIDLATRDWVTACKRPGQTDLEFILELLERSGMAHEQQVLAFEHCQLPIVYDLGKAQSGSCELRRSGMPTSYQKNDVARETFPLPPVIRRPLKKINRLSPQDGRALLDLSLRALCARNLEIYPLFYANPADVTVVDAGRGVEIALTGVQPERRNALESLFFFLILKNGVPVAYGPASVFLGACEMGMNLFPEFRGGEIRYIYAQFMRVLYHLAHARYFYLTAYGMGENNDEALKSGAFWFYRKLGFQPTNPAVQALALEEEAKMRDTPGYRSDLPTLRKLSHTMACLDLSGGKGRVWPFGKIGAALSRDIAREFDGDRAACAAEGMRWAKRVLNIDAKKWTAEEAESLRRLAPILRKMPEIADWTAPKKRALAAALKHKGGRNESSFPAALMKLDDFRRAFARYCDSL